MTGIYHLFGENKKAKKDFFNYWKEQGDCCDYDLEILETDLFFPSIGNTQRYLYLDKGSLSCAF